MVAYGSHEIHLFWRVGEAILWELWAWISLHSATANDISYIYAIWKESAHFWEDFLLNFKWCMIHHPSHHMITHKMNGEMYKWSNCSGEEGLFDKYFLGPLNPHIQHKPRQPRLYGPPSWSGTTISGLSSKFIRSQSLKHNWFQTSLRKSKQRTNILSQALNLVNPLIWHSILNTFSTVGDYSILLINRWFKSSEILPCTCPKTCTSGVARRRAKLSSSQPEMVKWWSSYPS